MDIPNIQANTPAPAIQQPQEAAQAPAPQEKSRPAPAFDEYVPEDKRNQEPIGLYRVVQEDGAPKIEFDDPDKAGAPDKTEQTTMDTGKVDREIRQLKEKIEQLQKQIEREDGPQKREQLEKQLARAQQEAARKDNDTYRRQHAEIS